MNYCHLDTPIGPLLVAGDERGLHTIQFVQGNGPASAAPHWNRNAGALKEATAQLQAYFSGTLSIFNLKLAPQTTPFQARVLEQLQSIPYGQTRSYGEVAQSLKRPGAARAVGTACARNPLPIVIPCHRIVGQRGKLTGFAGGLACKRWLINHESR